MAIDVDSGGDFSGSFNDDPNSVVTGTLAVDKTVSGTYQYPSQALHSFSGHWNTIQGGTYLVWNVTIDGSETKSYGFTR